MLSSRTIVALMTLSTTFLGCGLDGMDEEANQLPRKGDPSNSTMYVEGSEAEQSEPGEPQDNAAQPGSVITADPGQRLRVAMVIDISQSMNVTDPLDPTDGSTARQRAAQAVVDQLQGADAAFAIIPFNWKYPVVNAGMSDEFTSEENVIEPALATLSQGTGTGDYQGALTVVRDLLAADIAASTEEELARSTYTVIFVADGLPSLVCVPGCDGESLCDEPREQWLGGSECNGGECGGPTKDNWPMLEQCGAYNTPQSLQELAAQLAALSQMAEIRLNTVLMATPLSPAWVNESSVKLLSGLAAAGGGSFLEVFDPTNLSFINPFGLGL